MAHAPVSYKFDKITVIMSGGRDYADVETVRRVLDCLDPENIRIFVGDATGLDEIVRKIAPPMGFEVKSFKANWRQYRKGAGAIRNLEMIKAGGQVLIAFPGGPGTADMIQQARKHGLGVIELL